MSLSGYDFSGKRVRKDGKVLDKFSLCQEIHDLNLELGGSYYSTLSYHLYPEIYSYSDCFQKLLSLVIFKRDLQNE